MAVTDGLIARYNFDGDTVDATGITGDATAVGSTYTTPGIITPFAKGILHDGINDYGLVPTTGINRDNLALSVGGWNYFTNVAGAYESIITCGSAAAAQANKFYLAIRRSAAGKIEFLIGKSQVYVAWVDSDAILLPNQNTNYHVFATYDGSKTFAGIKVYFAGSEIAVTPHAAFGALADVYESWRFGNDQSLTLDMAGKQNQMLLYNQVVSATDIESIYDAGVAGVDIFAGGGASLHASTSIYDDNFSAFKVVGNKNTIV